VTPITTESGTCRTKAVRFRVHSGPFVIDVCCRGRLKRMHIETHSKRCYRCSLSKSQMSHVSLPQVPGSAHSIRRCHRRSHLDASRNDLAWCWISHKYLQLQSKAPCRSRILTRHSAGRITESAASVPNFLQAKVDHVRERHLLKQVLQASRRKVLGNKFNEHA